MKHFCTYFDRNYLCKGLALIESLRRYHRGDFRLYVVCMDELSRVILQTLGFEEVVCIPLHEIEKGDTRLLATRTNRTAVEYLWTTTPTIILRLVERLEEGEVLTYLDADLYLFSGVEPLYKELGVASVLIHAHRFPPELAHLAQYGIYNVGLMSFRNNHKGREVLNWWRDRCIEWCYATPENGLFGDQVYLNDWPERYGREVVATDNIGIGTAPWNHAQYKFDKGVSAPVTVNGTPLMVYHFHAFYLISPEIIVPAQDTAYKLPKNFLSLCVLPYLDSIHTAIGLARSILPDFNHGLVKPDFSLSAEHSFLVTRDVYPEVQKLNIPQTPSQMNEKWVCYVSNQVI